MKLKQKKRKGERKKEKKKQNMLLTTGVESRSRSESYAGKPIGPWLPSDRSDGKIADGSPRALNLPHLRMGTGAQYPWFS